MHSRNDPAQTYAHIMYTSACAYCALISGHVFAVFIHGHSCVNPTKDCCPTNSRNDCNTDRVTPAPTDECAFSCLFVRGYVHLCVFVNIVFVYVICACIFACTRSACVICAACMLERFSAHKHILAGQYKLRVFI